ncbi:hypothetical protein Vadar_031117 [Vaccinium darrowii]|uniref:Uncharacterized protein n=1 Tax=Vaccinium darrowii TaxID=229202 RepID=A0ACB7Z7L8_9ERIC|nr:hypothetical protein Vadar_031117 [Vaccinium darrowii]
MHIHITRIRDRLGLEWGELGFEKDVDVTSSGEEAVAGGVGVEPPGEVECGLDELELAVSVENADIEVGEVEGGLEEEENDEPLVV